MSKKSSKHEEEGEGNNERWLLTYSDMVTLLLALFVYLFSISEIDSAKASAFSQSMAELFGIGRVPESPTSGSGGSGILPEANAIVQLQQQVTEDMEELIEDDMVEVTETEEGLRVLLKDKVLFSLGSAQINESAKAILRKLSMPLIDMPNNIRVEGHTDNLPMAKGSRYPSNWELSGARASSVVKFFIEDCDIDPKRLTVAGYAEYRPLKPNLPLIGNSENRRVEIVILRTRKNKIKEPAVTQPHIKPAPQPSIEPDTHDEMHEPEKNELNFD